MKTINAKYIKSLKPCTDSYEKGIKSYPNFEGTLSEFLDLDEISHEDKLWVYLRSINKKLVLLVAADFAEKVLHIYEEKYPGDLRPRQAIEAARNKSKNRNAAEDAAAATYSPAITAAYANADYAAIYDAAADVDYATAASVATTAFNMTKIDIHKIQIQIMKKYL